MEDIKIPITKKQFAEVLYHWLSRALTKKEIKRNAVALDFKLIKDDDFRKIFEEYLVFDMWSIVYTCERLLENEEIRNECLDIFHNMVYNGHINSNEFTFKNWMISISSRYIEYNKAMKIKHPPNPLWAVVKEFNRNLFGRVRKDFFVQMDIIGCFKLFVSHIEKAILEYDIV